MRVWWWSLRRLSDGVSGVLEPVGWLLGLRAGCRGDLGAAGGQRGMTLSGWWTVGVARRAQQRSGRARSRANARGHGLRAVAVHSNQQLRWPVSCGPVSTAEGCGPGGQGMASPGTATWPMLCWEPRPAGRWTVPGAQVGRTRPSTSEETPPAWLALRGRTGERLGSSKRPRACASRWPAEHAIARLVPSGVSQVGGMSWPGRSRVETSR
jgi:hypothetical protein